MIHIVFQASDMNTIAEAQKLDETLSGSIIQIKDDFAIGPLLNLETEEGWQERVNWWRELISYSPYTNDLAGSFDDRETVKELKVLMTEDPKETIWIWMGQNQHDVCGYYWLISQLQELQGRVYVLYLNNLPFINEKGNIFYPGALHEIAPKEFLKAKKLNRKVTLSEMEVDPDEWKRLCQENSMVRILEGGKKIAGRNEDFYDENIIKSVTPEWQKGSKVMGAIFNKMKVKTGDIYLLWRMKALAEKGLVEINGETQKGWKEFELRSKADVAETINQVVS